MNDLPLRHQDTPECYAQSVHGCRCTRPKGHAGEHASTGVDDWPIYCTWLPDPTTPKDE